jgi:hypothetical protein
MRGQQFTFIGPRRLAKIIRLIHEHGQWHGRRGKMTLTIFRPAQQDIEGRQFEFTATLFYDRVNGHAATVAEVIEKLEQLYRERTRQHDPRSNRNAGRSGNSDRGRAGDSSHLQEHQLENSSARAPRAPRASTRGRKRDQ